MSFFDAITGTVSRGLGAIGGFASDVFGIAAPIFAEQLAGRAVAAAAPRGSGGVIFGATPGTAARLGSIPTFSGETLGLPVGAPLGFPIQTGGINMPAPLAFPGGAPIQQAGLLGPGLAAGLGSALGSFFGSGGGEGAVATVQALREMRPGAQPGAIFRVAGPRLVARRLLRVTNPSTGNDVYYRNVGQPILFRGDLRVCKTVEKVARLARRVSRKR